MNDITILIIDDEENQLTALKSFLIKRQYSVFTALNGKEGYNVLNNNLIDIVITDLRMPESDGLDFLQNAKKLNPEVEVIVTSAFGTVEDAVNIMKQGAYDFITKPMDLDELEIALQKIIEKKYLLKENKELKKQLESKFNFQTIITRSELLQISLNQAFRVADSKATVLIRGESGTGKELFAKAVHFASNRKDKPFITVNVAALSENLLESELFGHEKGSFTGAFDKRIGRFEEADGGTLFIDEIGDIPLHLQVKLLRVIQFGEVQRIGSNQTIKTNVRIIAATNRNLEEMINDNEFREDLYYRLKVVEIFLPALKERKTDIPILIEHFYKKHSKENEKEINGITQDALDILLKYNYPGNVRELENIIERAVIFSRDGMIKKEDLPNNLGKKNQNDIFDPTNFEIDYQLKMNSFEIAIIQEALSKTNGNKSAAARLLKITERHLRSRLQILNLK